LVWHAPLAARPPGRRETVGDAIADSRRDQFVRHHIARLLAVVALGASGLVGCSSPAAADPYQLLDASLRTGWDPVQVNVGFQISAPGSSVTIDRSAIGAVLEMANRAGAIHVSLPATDLGLSRAQLRTMGIDASSIQLDMIFDGDALYGKSPLLAAGMKELLGADTPEGDLTGWLRILSTAEVEDLQPFGRGLPAPTTGPLPSGGGSLKGDLEAAGLTVSLVGTEKVAGADTRHLKIAIDGQKLLASPLIRQSDRAGQLDRIRGVIDQVRMSADLWIDVATSHLTEIDGHLGQLNASSDVLTMTMVFTDPDGSIPVKAPAKHVDLPAKKLLEKMMRMVAPGLPVA